MQTLFPLVCGYVAHVEHVGGTGRYGRSSVAWVKGIGAAGEACQAVNAQFLLGLHGWSLVSSAQFVQQILFVLKSHSGVWVDSEGLFEGMEGLLVSFKFFQRQALDVPG